MKELCLTLLAFVAQHSGYDAPDKCPSVESASQEVLQQYVCPDQDCPVSGIYVYGQQKLLVDNSTDLNGIYTRSVIVHELVHYLQDSNGEAMDKGCAAHMLRERVAFFVQEKYLRSNYLRADLRANLSLYSCEDSEG